MAKILCINSVTYREGVNNIGDVVGVFADDWKFTDNELTSFDIVDVVGTKEEVEALLPKLETKQVVKVIDIINPYQEFTQSDVKQVWNDKGFWKELIKTPKYSLVLSIDAKSATLTNVILKAPTLVENNINTIAFKTKEQIALEITPEVII